MFDRELLRGSALDVAPLLLGATLSHVTVEGTVAVRITEVEAYLGESDPGSHAFRGRTKRNAAMFGDAGYLYTYFTYGMHVCANVVTGPLDQATGVLLRAGEVVEGIELARVRRASSQSDADLARGPARLVVALGIALEQGGADLAESPFSLTLAAEPLPCATSPRTGISGIGGSSAYPWRYYLAGHRSVSPYRKQQPRRPPAKPE